MTSLGANPAKAGGRWCRRSEAEDYSESNKPWRAGKGTASSDEFTADTEHHGLIWLPERTLGIPP